MRKFDQSNLEQIGTGYEKNVYDHPDDERKLIAFLKKNEAPRFLKAQYYLTKIAHMLLPNNVPDIHFAGGEENQALVVEKKSLDEGHNKTRDNILKFHRTGVPDIAQADDREAEVHSDSRYAELRNKFTELRLSYDHGVSNFGLDKEGNMVYIDTLYPWESIKDGEVVKSFDKDKLTEAISTLAPDQQKTALSYLERLEVLYQEEVTKSGKEARPQAA
jgi:hypothetical protein